MSTHLDGDKSEELDRLIANRNNVSRTRSRVLEDDAPAAPNTPPVEDGSSSESEASESGDDEEISGDEEEIVEIPIESPEVEGPNGSTSEDDAPESPEDADEDAEEDGNPITALEIKKKLLTLAIEIKSLEAQLPTVDATLDAKHKHLQTEIELQVSKTKMHQLDNEKHELINKWETLQVQGQMDRLEDQVVKRQKLDILRLEHGIDDLADGRARKRKDLEMDTEITIMESQRDQLKDIVRLRGECEIIRLQNDLEFQKYRTKRQRRIAKVETTHLNLAEREAREQWNDWVDQEPEYLLNPVRTDRKTGQTELVVSDRVVHLNGPIVYQTINYIVDRINYFDNKDHTLPIFLIMDYCPGGSVMAGFQIQKAMESCKAPIYTVVKSFAASMAATITSLANKSFVLHNAEILHHQILCNPGYGNLTQQREAQRSLEECWERLAGPVAKKVGMTLEEWRKAMYDNNCDGDWCVFGDKAVELKWADQVIDRIRYTGNTRNPDWWRRYLISMQDNSAQKKIGQMSDNVNSERLLTSAPNQQQLQMQSVGSFAGVHPNESEPEMRKLPPLRPRDHYLIHNPNNYYQI